jgi:hypothetical protein
MPCNYCNCGCIEITKTCNICNIEQDITNFNKLTPTSLRGFCKSCQSVKNNKYYNDIKSQTREPVTIYNKHIILYVKNGNYTIIDKQIYETDPEMFKSLKYTDERGVYIPSTRYKEMGLPYISLPRLVTGTLYNDVKIEHINGDVYDNRISNLKINI